MGIYEYYRQRRRRTRFIIFFIVTIFMIEIICIEQVNTAFFKYVYGTEAEDIISLTKNDGKYILYFFGDKIYLN